MTIYCVTNLLYINWVTNSSYIYKKKLKKKVQLTMLPKKKKKRKKEKGPVQDELNKPNTVAIRIGSFYIY